MITSRVTRHGLFEVALGDGEAVPTIRYRGGSNSLDGFAEDVVELLTIVAQPAAPRSTAPEPTTAAGEDPTTATKASKP